MPKKKEVMWNGIEYESITACAKANNTSCQTMTARIKKGHICDGDAYVGGRRKPVVWNGVTYNSFTECAESIGVSPMAVGYRYRKGWVCDDEVPPAFGNEKETIPCEWEGAQYNSIQEAAKAHGIKQFTMHRWIAIKGFTCFDDLNKYTWEGERYRSISAICESTGHSIYDMGKWIGAGYTCIEEVPSPSITFVINKVGYHTLQEAGAACGLTRENIRQKIERYGRNLLYYPEGNRPGYKSTRKWFANKEDENDFSTHFRCSIGRK